MSSVLEVKSTTMLLTLVNAQLVKVITAISAQLLAHQVKFTTQLYNNAHAHQIKIGMETYAFIVSEVNSGIQPVMSAIASQELYGTAFHALIHAVEVE